jgi:predicted nucleotide-binding protein (sugar kinase/HSP70/actin superfamily)
VPVVGIPRALLFYHYYPLWRDFLEGLGCKVVESGPTTRKILQQGVTTAVDETCLPVKIFYGHVRELKDRVDYLFLPRLVSVQKGAYICPKFLGLPDMIRHSLPDLPPLIAPTINLNRRGRGLLAAVAETAALLKANSWQTWTAFSRAWRRWRRWQGLQRQGLFPLQAQELLDGKAREIRKGGGAKLRVGVLGHPYNIYDDYVNMGLLGRLEEMGVEVRTPEMLPPRTIAGHARRLPKELFWTLGRSVMGAASHFLTDPGIDGIIHLISFGCGPDSLVGELVERRAQRGQGFPFLLLTLDEHSGEVGLTTRLEAFVDTLEWRQEE